MQIGEKTTIHAIRDDCANSDLLKRAFPKAGEFKETQFREDIEKLQREQNILRFEQIPYDINLCLKSPELTATKNIASVTHFTARKALAIFRQFLEDQNLMAHYVSSVFELKCGFWLTSMHEKSLDYRLDRYDWLKTCYTISPATNFYFLTHSAKINREDEIREMLFKEDKLHDYFVKDGKGHAYSPLLIDWFLRRYDLLTAWKIDAALNHSWFLKLFSSPTINGLMLILFVLIAISGMFLYLGPFDLSWAALFDFEPPFTSDSAPLDPKVVIFNNSFSVLVGVVYFLAIRMVVLGMPRIRLLMPRMVGSLLIGFFPLITSKDFWTLSQNLNCWQVTVLALLAYVIAFFYLRFEINNLVRSNTAVADKPGDKWDDKGLSVLTASELTKRAVCVALIGILYSFGIAVVVNDLLGAFLIEISESAAVEVALCGIFGLIYPKTVLLLSGFALVLGIFVQIIWQDNTIAEPL